MTPSKSSIRAAERIYAEWFDYPERNYDQPAKLRTATALLKLRNKANPTEGADRLWDLFNTGPSQDWTKEQKIEAAARMIEEME